MNRQLNFSFPRIFVLILSVVITACGDAHMPLPDSAEGVGNPTAGSVGGSNSNGSILSGPSEGGETAKVTYVRDIYPIFKKNCGACHNASSPNPNWLDYKVALARKDRILDRVVIKKNMPVGKALEPSDIGLIAQWIQFGAPEGSTSSGSTTLTPAPAPAPAPAPSLVPVPVPSAAPTTAPTAQPAPISPPTLGKVTFEEVLKPKIFQNVCFACHNPDTGLPDWTDYAVAFERRDLLYKRIIEDRDMPIPNAGFDITEEERKLIADWVKAGAPRTLNE